MENIKIIDLNFLGVKGVIASFLVEGKDGLVLIETGPDSSYSTLKKTISTLGYNITDIKQVLITHIHLDHSGAAWQLAKNGATIYVHPNGVEHLINPEKLVKSATRIYGDKMDFLWGKIEGINPENVKVMSHNEKLKLAGEEFVALFTPGHAQHHIAWQYKNVIFAGDVGGVKVLNGLVVPPCPPPDINIEEWIQSIDLILKAKPQRVYLTHFGYVENIESHFADLKEKLLDWSNWMKNNILKYPETTDLNIAFANYTHQQMQKNGMDKELIEKYEKVNPLWMCVQGLVRYHKSKV